MFIAFLIGLLAVVATILITVVAMVCGRWLKSYVKNKIKNREKHKVAFADTREVVDDYIKEKVEAAEGISMDELEKMCEETPFVAAVIDEDGEISEYEGFKAEDYNENFRTRMKQQKGMIIVGYN